MKIGAIKMMFDHSKLDFKVEKFPLINEYQSGFMTEQSPISSSIGVGIRRVDNKQPLGIVSDK